MNGIFDSHAHYNDPAFENDADAVITNLFENGVFGIMNVGYNYQSIELAQNQANKYENIWFAAGIHPHDSADLDADYIERLSKYASDRKCAAIGEIGLDYFRNSSPKIVQQRVFERQLKLAEQLDMPVIIHSREATRDTLDILKQHSCKGVVHCFSSSAQTAEEVLKLGYYIGFTGVVTFNNAKKAVEAAKAVPLERLLVETDCPYMAPVPHRGERCTSDMIEFTAAKLAEIKGVTAQELIDITRENAKRLYRIK